MGSLPGCPRFRGNPLVDRRRFAAPDSEILDWAAANNCIVLTHDLDFGMLLAALRTDAPSVVQVRCQDVLPASIGDIVVRAIRATEHQLEAGVWLPWILPAIGFDSFHFEDSTPGRDARGFRLRIPDFSARCRLMRIYSPATSSGLSDCACMISSSATLLRATRLCRTVYKIRASSTASYSCR